MITKISNTTLDPLSLNKTLSMLKKRGINNVVLEASSHGLKQYRLHGLLFNVGIFTNLSRDHLDYHESFKDYFDSKMILFKNLMKRGSFVIYNKDTKISKKVKQILKKQKLKSITCGKKDSDLILKNTAYVGNEQKVLFEYKNKEYSFKTNLISNIQIRNLLIAILAANKILSMKKILSVMNKIKSVDGRLESISSIKNNSKVILDYAHTPDALETSLKDIKSQFRFSKISIVFGCGGERDKPKRNLMGKITNKLCDKIYLTDDNPRSENPSDIRKQIKKNIKKSKLKEISSRAAAIKEGIENLNSGDVLVVAGKGHEDYQEYRKKKFFSDKICIKKNIKIKNKKLSYDWKLNIIQENLKDINLKKVKKINNASLNSKEISKNDIFFGVKGKKIDGNKFANEAIKNGASLSVIDKKYSNNLNKIVKVNKSLKFFSHTSNVIRKVSNISAIAITGSAGKTSLKELLGQSLMKINSTCYSKKSFNNKYGVPLSLFNINKKNVFGVFEVGMDRKGEIDNLTKIIMPDIAVITNVSYAHIKNFKNLHQIAKAKSEIIDNIIDDASLNIFRE